MATVREVTVNIFVNEFGFFARLSESFLTFQSHRQRLFVMLFSKSIDVSYAAFLSDLQHDHSAFRHV